jgi:hypothetical protein
MVGDRGPAVGIVLAVVPDMVAGTHPAAVMDAGLAEVLGIAADMGLDTAGDQDTAADTGLDTAGDPDMVAGTGVAMVIGGGHIMVEAPGLGSAGDHGGGVPSASGAFLFRTTQRRP